MSMYENVGMTSLDYLEEILRLRKALADVADECSKAYDRIAELENPWVSIKDKMPDKNKNVLVCGVHKAKPFVEVDFYCDDECFFYNDGLDGEKVTHWMSLPQPPESEE